MKWLLYILLLANLASFFWHYQSGLFHAEAGKKSQSANESESPPQLVLLREYQARPSAQSSAETDRGSCFNLGPFDAREAAVEINKELARLGITATLEVNKDRTRPGYWVLIPPLQDRQAAQKTIAELREKQIKDYFLVATGSQKNAISLGVFSRLELAQRRHNAMQKLGFSVRVEKVDLPRREYWLEWPIQTETGVNSELLEAWRKRFPAVGSTRRPCRENS